MIPDSQEMPAPIRYTKEEGGMWYDWDDKGARERLGSVSAIIFANGAVFDAINGWRRHKFCPHCGQRKIDMD